MASKRLLKNGDLKDNLNKKQFKLALTPRNKVVKWCIKDVEMNDERRNRNSDKQRVCVNATR